MVSRAKTVVHKDARQQRVVGIDLGSLNSVVGVSVGLNAVDILQNAYGSRSTEMWTANSSDRGRQFAFAVGQYIDTEPQKCFLYPTRFFDCKVSLDFEKEKEFTTHRIDSQLSDTRVEEIKHKVDEDGILAQQAVGSVIAHLRKLAEVNGQQISKVVFTVPDYLSDSGQKCVLESAMIAGFVADQVSLVEESTAIALQYRNQWSNEINQVFYRRISWH